jgi:hypothetical protein
MNAPKVTNAPEEIYLCYGHLKDDMTHEEASEMNKIYWNESPDEGADIKYIRADVMTAIHPAQIPGTQTIAPEECWLECVNMGAVLPRTQNVKYIRADIIDALRAELAETQLAYAELLEETQCDR